ncbi:hypothetical protein BsWGS_14977 [Bradybaena similaris]
MSADQGYVVRLRGLPWSCTAKDVINFLRECNIVDNEEGVHFTYSREGRPSGEAFVELESEDDVSKALAQNYEHIETRYIEVFRVTKSEMDWIIKRAGSDRQENNENTVVKLRGLPFGCSKEEIAHFFTGLEIVPNGIMLPEDRQGRDNGEAFVQFVSSQIADRALKKHKEWIGHRYIEIFKSSMSEANASVGGMRGGIYPLMGMPRPWPYNRDDRYSISMGSMGYGGRGRSLERLFGDYYDDYGFSGGMGYGMCSCRSGGIGSGPRGMGMMNHRGMQPWRGYMSKTGHTVHMRGLPFEATEQDVFDFFSPIQPVQCTFEFGYKGRPTGEANVDFATHQEAIGAMKKHRTNMQHRYILLFLNSEQNPRDGPGGYGNSGWNW